MKMIGYQNGAARQLYEGNLQSCGFHMSLNQDTNWYVLDTSPYEDMESLEDPNLPPPPEADIADLRMTGDFK